MSEHRQTTSQRTRNRLIALAVFVALMGTLIAMGSTPARSAPGDPVLGELALTPSEGPLTTVLDFATPGACPGAAEGAFTRLLGPGIDSESGYTGLFKRFDGDVTSGPFSWEARVGLAGAQVDLGIVFDGVYQLRVSCAYPIGATGTLEPYGDFVIDLTITPTGDGLGEFVIGGEEPVEDFSDVPPTHQFYGDISWLVGEGITEGFPDGTFKPSNPVTRQAMAAFLYRYAGAPLGLDPSCATSPFPDVPQNHQFCGEIDWLVDEGITEGFPDGDFKPSNPVTRQAMAAFLYRVAEEPRGADPACTTSPFPDVPQSHQFCGEIDWLVDEGITEGFPGGDFRPSNSVTRQAMAAFLHRLALLP